jgi:hypothetical protein
MHGVRFNPIHKVINKHRTSSMIEEPMDMRSESENYSN